ncbi:hypothetical protein QE152_g38534 [Popillia japonica]|uniref:Uncharacterized protein n=1 Tax=Popillia japonica TaxID=7064 RepID=A0AAW1HWM1_POPJA
MIGYLEDQSLLLVVQEYRTTFRSIDLCHVVAPQASIVLSPILVGTTWKRYMYIEPKTKTTVEPSDKEPPNLQAQRRRAQIAKALLLNQRQLNKGQKKMLRPQTQQIPMST